MRSLQGLRTKSETRSYHWVDLRRRLEKKLDGNLKEYADIIAKEVGRLEGILNEILSFVKETRLNKEAVGF